MASEGRLAVPEIDVKPPAANDPPGSVWEVGPREDDHAAADFDRTEKLLTISLLRNESDEQPHRH